MTNTLCSLMPKRFQSTPARSLRWVTLPTSPWATNSFIAFTLWSRPATPTNCTLPAYLAAVSWTLPAWPRQVAHHGAQNHRMTGLPASVPASNGWPSSVVPVNCNDAGTVTGLRCKGAAKVEGAAAQPAGSRSTSAARRMRARMPSGTGTGPSRVQQFVAAPQDLHGAAGRAEVRGVDVLLGPAGQGR